MPGGIIRCSWIESGGTLFPIDAVDYDPTFGSISTSQYETFVSSQPVASARVSPAPLGAPVAVVAEASEPPNDRLQFGEMESDGVWDAALGKINGNVNVTGAEPFVDVWADGSVHVYWIRTVPGGMEMGQMSRGSTVQVPVAVGGPPPSAALAPRISVVPNPARGIVTLSWAAKRRPARVSHSIRWRDDCWRAQPPEPAHSSGTGAMRSARTSPRAFTSCGSRTNQDAIWARKASSSG